MMNELKKRIYTSLALFILMFLMFINNYISAYFLTILGILSLLEFFKTNTIIYKKSKNKQLIINLFFICYIFFFCYLFIILSSTLHLKVLLFIILITCVASDIGGLFFGKILKGPKLTIISPKKTVSGSIGSLIFSTTVFSYLIFFFTNNFSLIIVCTGLIISIGCQLGDLFFSYIKRKALLKDFANYLPGHGGVLDRVDGILLGIPLGFLSLMIFY
tara:strand:- start:121 stop:771 length:651 start_codon:yes stop_codon:yes gene_type:complete